MTERTLELNELLKSRGSMPLNSTIYSTHEVNDFLKEAYQLVRGPRIPTKSSPANTAQATTHHRPPQLPPLDPRALPLHRTAPPRRALHRHRDNAEPAARVRPRDYIPEQRGPGRHRSRVQVRMAGHFSQREQTRTSRERAARVREGRRAAAAAAQGVRRAGELGGGWRGGYGVARGRGGGRAHGGAECRARERRVVFESGC